MTKRLVAMLLLSVLALLSGCGDDEESPARASGDEDGLTQAEYVKRATALCTRHREEISDQLAAFMEGRGEGAEVADKVATEAMEEVMLPGFRSEFEALRELPAPRGDEDFLLLMLLKFAASLENGEEDLDRLFRLKLSAYSEFAEGSLMTREYGIKGCGSLRRSPGAVVSDYLAS